MGMEVFDLASASSAGSATGALRQLNQRLHDLTEETAGRRRGGFCIHAVRTRLAAGV